MTRLVAFESSPRTPCILVTGGGGYLGAILVPELLAKGYRVTVLDTFVYGREVLKSVENHPGIKLIQGDLCSTQLVSKALDGIDSVIHLASISNDPTGDLDPWHTVETNIRGTRALAELAKEAGVKRFLFPSSCAVYGASGSRFLTETSLVSPISLYALSKLESEKDLLALADDDFCVSILRMATLFGCSPRMRLDLVVNIMAWQALCTRNLAVDGSGMQYRPLLHVRDAADIFISLLQLPRTLINREIYNAGKESLNYRIIDLANLISGTVRGSNLKFTSQANDQRSYRVSFNKIQKELNLYPRRGVLDGVREIGEALSSGILKKEMQIPYSNILTLKNNGKGATGSLRTTSQPQKPKVIAMILAYNCASMLERAYQKIPKGLVDDIFVMDDGSQDATSDVAKKLGLKTFRNQRNLGYGGNVKAGLKTAFDMGADYVVEIHGDGAQFDPKSIRFALPHLYLGADLVLGSRFQSPMEALKNGMPWIRFLANQFLSFFDRRVLKLPLTEFHTGFRIYGRGLFEEISLENSSNDYLFSFEIIAQAAFFGKKVVEVPVEADYLSPHTSHALSGACIYAFKTFGVLKKFISAKQGIKIDPLFSVKKSLPTHVEIERKVA